MDFALCVLSHIVSHGCDKNVSVGGSSHVACVVARSRSIAVQLTAEYIASLRSMQVVHISMCIVGHSIASIDKSRLGQNIGSCASGKTDTTKISYRM